MEPMNSRSIVTVILLVFVGVSVAYVLVREAGTGREDPSPLSGESSRPSLSGEDRPETENPTGEAGDDESVVETSPAPGGGAVEPGAEEAGRKVLVYYFHRTQRCPTCRAIESYAREAVEQAFPAELESGRVEWHTVNLDEPGQSHFVDDYQLTFSTLVVVAKDGGSQTSWRNLSDVWGLVRGQRAKYDAYVRDAVAEYLGG